MRCPPSSIPGFLTGRWANPPPVPVPFVINELHGVFPNTAAFTVSRFICKRKIYLPLDERGWSSCLHPFSAASLFYQSVLCPGNCKETFQRLLPCHVDVFSC